LKTEKEIREGLKKALKNWHKLGSRLRFDLDGNVVNEEWEPPCLGKIARSTVPFSPWAMRQLTYQLWWLQFSPQLPKGWRQAANLRYIWGWEWEEISRKLKISVKSSLDYAGKALSEVATQIYMLHPAVNTCPRCGGGT
jgi:DNA-directed RNA polymerase specialized sigma24 family protein